MKLRKAMTASLMIVCLLLVSCRNGDAQIADRMLDGSNKAFRLKSVTGLQQVAQLTGKESMNGTDRYAVSGTDLGSMFQAGDRTYFVFGDTFGDRSDGSTGAGGSFWRSNTLAYSTDIDPSDGITFDGMITDEIGLAKELLPSKKNDFDEMTKIPTHGLYANDVMYLYYMSVNHWGDPGQWDANYSSIAKSTNDGKDWTLLDEVKWPGDSSFIQVSPFKMPNGKDHSDIYFWCIPSGRFGGVKLMKVNEAAIEDINSYDYFAGIDKTGEPVWSKAIAEAQLVVDDRAGELSVIWNPYLDSWIMTYLEEGEGVVLREGVTPWGPWSETTLLVSSTEYPGLYGPYMNPQYMEDGGSTIYFTLSLWEPYNVFWYKATLHK
ncbi:carbohydrate-binding protein [Paenibacillus sp. FSL H8-0548]|nr:carbohydrate-binding protein [Paenibacillus sp. FSL H8-0548]